MAYEIVPSEDPRDDDYTWGWGEAKRTHETGVDVTTHRSQGDSEFDRGWNAFIDQLEAAPGA